MNRFWNCIPILHCNGVPLWRWAVWLRAREMWPLWRESTRNLHPDCQSSSTLSWGELAVTTKLRLHSNYQCLINQLVTAQWVTDDLIVSFIFFLSLQNSVIHRDLKLENILLNQDEQPKVTLFTCEFSHSPNVAYGSRVSTQRSFCLELNSPHLVIVSSEVI